MLTPVLRSAPLALLAPALLAPALFAPRTAAAQPAGLVQSSTRAAGLYPEDRGELPADPMPEGGVGNGLTGAPDGGPQRIEPDQSITPPGSDEDTRIRPAEGEPNRLRTHLDGYVRVLGELVQESPEAFVGHNTLFRLANARLGIESWYGHDLHAYLSLEAATVSSTGQNDPNANLAVGVRDAYFAYEISRRAGVVVGRFKAPYDLGSLESTRERIFIDEPLETSGVAATHGFERVGMTQNRQIGIMLQRQRMGLSSDGLDLGYAIALTNGNTGDRVFNDNTEPAGFLRLSAHYGQWLSLNVAGFLDRQTIGTLPNLNDQKVSGAEVSLQVRCHGLRLEAQVLAQHVKYETVGQAAIDPLGFHAQAAYRWNWLEAAYRYAWYDPQLTDHDRVMEHTIGLTYYPGELPLRFIVNGTIAQEQQEIKNNRVAALAQFEW